MTEPNPSSITKKGNHHAIISPIPNYFNSDGLCKFLFILAKQFGLRIEIDEKIIYFGAVHNGYCLIVVEITSDIKMIFVKIKWERE